jgi:OOP family OmpA-OmpF porin
MKQRTSLSAISIAIAFALAAAAAAATAHAAPAESVAGPYVGASLGISGFGTRDVAAPKVSSDERGRAFRVYGGYQLNESFGLQAGYVRLGRLDDRFTVGLAAVKQSVSGRSLYVAGTGRLPLGESFALTGKLGLSFGKTSGTNVLASSDSLIGSKRSLLVGLGGEYRLNRDVALTVDYESYGKLSNKLIAGALFAGARFSF